MSFEDWLPVIPSLAAIIFSIWTKQVIPSLFIGLWLGSLLNTRSFLDSLNAAVSYILGVFTDTGNLNVLLFLYMFSGLVALIRISGGVQAFAERIGNILKDPIKPF
ncbi:hypothetical protein GCM10009865_43380 [Aeromicrobium ponti]